MLVKLAQSRVYDFSIIPGYESGIDDIIFSMDDDDDDIYGDINSIIKLNRNYIARDIFPLVSNVLLNDL